MSNNPNNDFNRLKRIGDEGSEFNEKLRKAAASLGNYIAITMPIDVDELPLDYKINRYQNSPPRLSKESNRSKCHFTIFDSVSTEIAHKFARDVQEGFVSLLVRMLEERRNQASRELADLVKAETMIRGVLPSLIPS